MFVFCFVLFLFVFWVFLGCFGAVCFVRGVWGRGAILGILFERKVLKLDRQCSILHPVANTRFSNWIQRFHNPVSSGLTIEIK